jgi:hypothetical protein
VSVLNVWTWVSIGAAAYFAMGVLTAAFCIFLVGLEDAQLTVGEVLAILVFWFVVLPVVLAFVLASWIGGAMTARFRAKAEEKPPAWEEGPDL